MQLEHARRESELLRRISSVEGEMAKLAAQLESERCELESKQRDLEKVRVASREVLLPPPLLSCSFRFVLLRLATTFRVVM